MDAYFARVGVARAEADLSKVAWEEKHVDDPQSLYLYRVPVVDPSGTNRIEFFFCWVNY